MTALFRVPRMIASSLVLLAAGPALAAEGADPLRLSDQATPMVTAEVMGPRTAPILELGDPFLSTGRLSEPLVLVGPGGQGTRALRLEFAQGPDEDIVLGAHLIESHEQEPCRRRSDTRAPHRGDQALRGHRPDLLAAVVRPYQISLTPFITNNRPNAVHVNRGRGMAGRHTFV